MVGMVLIQVSLEWNHQSQLLQPTTLKILKESHQEGSSLQVTWSPDWSSEVQPRALFSMFSPKFKFYCVLLFPSLL